MTVPAFIHRSRAWWPRREVAIVFAFVLASVVFSAAVDIAIWRQNNFEVTKLNGSTVRAYRELAYSPYMLNQWHGDSWGIMYLALDVLESPDRHQLYEKLFFGDKRKFQYPPSSMMYFTWLYRLGAIEPMWLNNLNAFLSLLNIGLVVFLFRAALRKFHGESIRPNLTDLALVGVMGLLYYPIVCAYGLGQIQVWINLLFTSACVFFLGGWTVMAGIALGIAASIKPQLALFALWALLWRQWGLLKGLIISGAVLGAISLWMYGWHNHVAYLDTLSYMAKHGEIFYPNQSINGLLNRLVHIETDNAVFESRSFAPYHPFVAFATTAAALGFLAIMLWPAVFDRNRQPDIFDFGIAAICATLSSPIAWQHHYGIMLPLLVVVLARLCSPSTANSGSTAGSERRTFYLLVLCTAWVLLTNWFAFLKVLRFSFLNVLQSHWLFGGLLLLGLMLALLGSRARAPQRRLLGRAATVS